MDLLTNNYADDDSNASEEENMDSQSATSLSDATLAIDIEELYSTDDGLEDLTDHYSPASDTHSASGDLEENTSMDSQLDSPLASPLENQDSENDSLNLADLEAMSGHESSDANSEDSDSDLDVQYQDNSPLSFAPSPAMSCDDQFVLKQPSSPPLFSKQMPVFEESQEERKRSERILNEAMKSGKVTLKIINVLIQGEAGAGKTSTRCILTGQPPPITRNSNPLANPPLQLRANSTAGTTSACVPASSQTVESTPTRKRASSAPPSDIPTPKMIRHISGGKIQSHQNRWKPIDRKELKKIVADVIAALSPTNQSEVESVNESLIVTNTSDSQHAKLDQSLDEMRASSMEENLQSLPSSIGSSIKEFPPVIADIHGEILELMTKENQTKLDSVCGRDPREILGSNWIYFTDSGGQPHFHNLLPHFIHSLSVVLFTLRLSERLDAHPMVEYHEQGQLIATPYQSHFTTEDTLKCLIRSIQSHSVDGEKPKLILVGTFLDKIQQCSENLSDKNKRLVDLLTPKFTDQLVFSKETMDELIFPINAYTPGVEEERIAELIQSEVQRAPSRVVDVPVWWYILEIALHKVSAKFNRLVLSMEECLEVARQLNISEVALVEALKFFHSQSIFLYYPDILPNVVFTSTQVLLDKLSELVKEAFLMREVCMPNAIPRRARTSKSGEWQKFRDQGIITLDFLERFPHHYVKGLFTASDLLEIFIRLLILTPFSSKLHDATKFASNSYLALYLMPSLLDMLPLDKLDEYRFSLVDFSFPPPLLILSPNGWPRAGVFCCLQVYLIQQLEWQLVTKKGRPFLLAQNCVMLSPPKSSCCVTLIDSFEYIEVHVKAKHSVCKKVCPTIVKNILDAIDASCQVVHYSNDPLQLAFFCPCEDSNSLAEYPRHPAELIQEEDLLRCTIDETNNMEATDKHMMWIKKAIITSSEAQLSPAINDILAKTGLREEDIDEECSDDHISEIAIRVNEWECVARLLDFETTDIEDVKFGTVSMNTQRINFLRKWKSMAAFNATYRRLIEALIKCKQTESAVHICSLLSSSQDVMTE